MMSPLGCDAGLGLLRRPAAHSCAFPVSKHAPTVPSSSLLFGLALVAFLRGDWLPTDGDCRSDDATACGAFLGDVRAAFCGASNAGAGTPAFATVAGVVAALAAAGSGSTATADGASGAEALETAPTAVDVSFGRSAAGRSAAAAASKLRRRRAGGTSTGVDAVAREARGGEAAGGLALDTALETAAVVVTFTATAGAAADPAAAAAAPSPRASTGEPTAARRSC
mmetsp:Transcript_23687/g.67731  ORF Transcript_23687/g.67731 Transcript_23687/m.67731 type:complete len:225 (-) Transcript_23687:419-1093(-)